MILWSMSKVRQIELGPRTEAVSRNRPKSCVRVAFREAYGGDSESREVRWGQGRASAGQEPKNSVKK